MINLTDSAHELRVQLSADKAGSPPMECELYASYRETTDTTYEFRNAFDYTTGDAAVTLISGASTIGTPNIIKAIDHISIYNPDTASVTVIVKFYNGNTGFEYTLVKQPLNHNETLTYNDKHGWGLS